MLCDLKRVMKPGAMLAVTVPHKDGSRAHYPGHIRFFGHVGLDDMLNVAGFTTMPSTDIGPWIMVVAYA